MRLRSGQVGTIYEKYLFLCNSVGAELMRRGDAAGALEALQSALHDAEALVSPREADRSARDTTA